ncbi:MAG: TIGR04255 family protein [Paraburkholderia sp.]|uniref:TIGR04255 family protein n=1 Tax=Paraburkholderia sp. TaxID=1926495 RepID=UPI003C5AA8E3
MNDRSGILKNSPLKYALASVRFAPLALLPNQIPEIHGRLRETLPLLQQVQQQIQIVGLMAPNFPQASHAWLIMSSDRSLGAQIGTEQILFFTTTYKRFTDFQTLILQCLEVLFDVVKFLDITAVGVRYVDRFKAGDSEELSNYMSPSFLTPRVSSFEPAGGLSQYAYRINDERLAVRFAYTAGIPSIPVDLMGLIATIQGPAQPLQIKALEEKEMLLDMDASRNFLIPQRVNSVVEIDKLLDSLHKRANAFFRHDEVFTEHAFSVWKGEKHVA